MMVTLCSLSGAPGVTTTALALASTWPTEDVTRVVEADASGGDIAAWWRLPVWNGVIDLAAASRPGQDHDHEDEQRFVQILPGGVRVCVAPASAERTMDALALITQHPKIMTSWTGVTLVDLGRVSPESQIMALSEEAAVTVVVTSGDLAQLKRLEETAPSLRKGAQLGVVVVGPSRSTHEIEQAIGIPVWGHLPWDRKTADVLTGRRDSVGRLHRRPLVTAARSLGHTITEKTQSHGDPVRAFQGGQS